MEAHRVRFLFTLPADQGRQQVSDSDLADVLPAHHPMIEKVEPQVP